MLSAVNSVNSCAMVRCAAIKLIKHGFYGFLAKFGATMTGNMSIILELLTLRIAYSILAA